MNLDSILRQKIFVPSIFLGISGIQKQLGGKWLRGRRYMGEFSGGEATKRESAIAEIEAATKSFLESRWHGVDGEVGSIVPTGSEREYPVADLLGRCFLRVCFWADLFASWTRRGRSFQVQVSADPAAGDLPIRNKSTIN